LTTQRPKIAPLLPKRSKIVRVRHHPALPFDQLPAFFKQLRAHEGNAARALEFAILTCARTGDIRYATFDEVDRRDALWTLTAERMKANRHPNPRLYPRRT
jgi:integrase